MRLEDAVQQLHDKLSAHRRVVVVATVILSIAIGVGLLATLKMEENIAAMLPDGKGTVARDFQLLQRAPFARKLLITVRGEPKGLLPATQKFKAALDPKLFTNVMDGVDQEAGLKLLKVLSSRQANLMTPADLAAIKTELTPEAITESVATAKRELMSPEGIVTKDAIIRDPLNLRRHALAKMRFVNMVPRVRLQDGHFVSKDGKSALLIADATVPMTDSRGGRDLLIAFEVAKDELPKGYSADLICSHRYTVANAEIIQGDLSVILTISAIGILLLFLLYLRSWRAVFVFLMPAVVLLLSLIGVSLVFKNVSAITVGFGAVLLGISVDFGLHIYFALRYNKGSHAQIVAQLARPLAFCALTTVGAFTVMLMSSLPGQRQLAVFSIAGIVGALVLSLVILPQFLSKVSSVDTPSSRFAAMAKLPKKAVLLPWIAIVFACVLFVPRLQFDGNLRKLGVVPKSIRASEKQMAATWGDYRGRAMIFSFGETLDDALAVNDKVLAHLAANKIDTDIVTLASILPSFAMQKRNTEAWEAFWAKHEAPTVANLTQAKWPTKAIAVMTSKLHAEGTIDADTLREAGLGGLLDSLILRSGGQSAVLTLVPDTPEVRAKFANGRPKNAVLVSQTATGEAIAQAISHDFGQFIMVAFAAIAALVAFLFRDWRRFCAALAPVVTGLICMAGTMGALGIEMNMFNVVAAILIIGLGVDYGIFMVHRSESKTDNASVHAVWVSGLTTLVGFGALTLGRHPSLRSIGMTVGIGIIFAVATALLVVPALLVDPGERKSTKT